MATFTKLDPQTHYSIIDPGTKDMIGWMWGFAALAKTNWPTGAKAFSENSDNAADVARAVALQDRA